MVHPRSRYTSEGYEHRRLSCTCRQNLFPLVAVPIGLLRLEEDPLAGDLYDGELLRALKRISRDYWTANPQESSQLLRLAERAVSESGNSEFEILPHDLKEVIEQK